MNKELKQFKYEKRNIIRINTDEELAIIFLPSIIQALWIQFFNITVWFKATGMPSANIFYWWQWILIIIQLIILSINTCTKCNRNTKLKWYRYI